MTITHTIGVIALGAILTLWLSQCIPPARNALPLAERSSPACWWSRWVRPCCSQRLRSRKRETAHHDHHHHVHEHHGHDHGHGHHHHHHHDHHSDDGLTSKGILGVGSCRRAACHARRRSSSCSRRSRCIASGLGLVLIIAFSVGLAATITGIGLVAVLARRAFGRLSLDGPARPSACPAVSAALILRRGRGDHRESAPRRSVRNGSSPNRTARSREQAACSGSTTGSQGSPKARRLRSCCFVGVLLGLRHATDPDHIAAMTTLVASGREKAARSAASLGAWWGIGHGITLVRLRRSDPARRALPSRARCSRARSPPSPSSSSSSPSDYSSVGVTATSISTPIRTRSRSTATEVRTPFGALGIGLVPRHRRQRRRRHLAPRGDPFGNGRRSRRSFSSRSSPPCRCRS